MFMAYIAVLLGIVLHNVIKQNWNIVLHHNTEDVEHMISICFTYCVVYLATDLKHRQTVYVYMYVCLPHSLVLFHYATL